MNAYIHPTWYYITAFIIFGLLVMSVINDILKKQKIYANINIYFDFLLFFKYVLNGLYNRGEIKITDKLIEKKAKKRNDCLRLFIGEIFWQKLARTFFALDLDII